MSWYYIKQQKTMGPVSDKEVLALVKSNKISAFDLLSNKDKKWQHAYRFEHFYNFFKNKKRKLHNEKYWVVMKLKDSGARLQYGPWSTEEVLASINNGSVEYADLIWCKDMSQWYPITLIEQFNPQTPFFYYKQEVEAQVFDEKQAKPYMIYVPELPNIELPPSEAEGESLV